MSMGLILGVVWLGVALLVLLGRRGHGLMGWVLAGAGIPVLGLLTYHHGPFWGLVAMAVGVLSLRAASRRAAS